MLDVNLSIQELSWDLGSDLYNSKATLPTSMMLIVGPRFLLLLGSCQGLLGIAETCKGRQEYVLVHVTLSLTASRQIIWHAIEGVGVYLVFLHVSLRMLRGTSQY